MSKYAFSDLHGSLKLYNEIEKFLQPEDIAFCLGDCGDRGPKSWETIKAVAANKQIIYLKGNHEDMLAKAMRSVIKNNGDINPSDRDIMLLIYNGGLSTLVDWMNEGKDKNWITYLDNLPTHIEFTNNRGKEVLLSHAGYTPSKGIPVNDKDLMWDRNHLVDKWLETDKDVIVVHGHTPMQNLHKELTKIAEFTNNKLPEFNLGAYWYFNNHKVDIDCGTFSSNFTLLLDLDTFNDFIFFEVKE